jgi:CPA2 family monovalent cation:H+ antiporter-2
MPHVPLVLRDLVLLVAAAIPAVLLARRFRIPFIVGYLVTGVVIGPHGLGLVSDPESVGGLAELGVVLLLFTIGLELSLSRIVRLGRTVVQGGGVQVGLTLVVAAAAATALGIPWNRAVFIGALMALSSTAIVLKVYADRQELDTPHGRVVVAILLFQDLCVVPLMLLVPVLAEAGAGLSIETLADVGIGLLAVAALVGAGRVVVPWVLDRAIGHGNREILTLAIVLFGLASTLLAASVGLSLALGAFLAGLVISESEYGLQALSDVLPFRDVFTGIFFISIGMLLDVGYVLERPADVFVAAVAVLFIKTGTAAAAVRMLRRSLQVSLRTGIALAQVGEFSFVLAGVGATAGLLDASAFQLFLATSVLTMFVTPFLIAAGPAVAAASARLRGHDTLDLSTREYRTMAALDGHAIIVGYGLAGQHLTRALRAAGIPYVVLEQNGQAVRVARRTREPVFFGDGTRREVLEHAGIARARVVVFSISSPADEGRGVWVARQANSDARIVVRTRFVKSVAELHRRGATDVIVEEYEAALELFSRVLRHYEIPTNTIAREVELARGEHYELLRGLARPDLRLDALKHLRIHTVLDLVEVEAQSRAVGESPTTLDLRQSTGAVVIAVVRDGVAHYTPDPSFRFQAGDTAVLVGNRDALERAGSVFKKVP